MSRYANLVKVNGQDEDQTNCKFCGMRIYWLTDRKMPPRSFNVSDGLHHMRVCRPNQILSHPAYKALQPQLPEADEPPQDGLYVPPPGSFVVA